jgi:hypothetical protein
MRRLEELFDVAVGQYQDGLPLHLSNPAQSVVAVMSAMEFNRKSAGEIQEVLRSKHLLISDCEQGPLKFDKAGMATLCMPTHPIEVQGKRWTFARLSDLDSMNLLSAQINLFRSAMLRVSRG